MNNVGKQYERQIKTISKSLVEIGGLSQTLLAAFLFLDYILGGPFRKLDLAISFRLMQ